jgi:enoyl-CoA hydratase
VTGEPEILFEQRGAAGIVTLNRPKALNALTHGMVLAMKAKLDEWAGDPTVGVVIVRGAGERAFCAGGDIRALAESDRAGTPYALDFWRDEYILNATIKHYPKPYVALIHGIVMGGGVGVSVHGRYRVGGETAMFAMPETGIGFFPDVGGSYFLPRCPGETGMYLALTGARLKTVDMQYVGVTTHNVPQTQWNDLVDAFAAGSVPKDVLAEFDAESAAPLAEHRAEIDRLFGADSIKTIMAGLDAESDEWVRATAATIRTKSPTSLKLTFREMREGRKLSFDECMRMEYRMASRILAGSDFYEGVRAVVVDKDNAPKWRPAALSEVNDKTIGAYFAPLEHGELKL